jgi:2'-5' RNA ligase
MPAHVTVLYPFVPSDELTPTVVAELERQVARFPRFTLTLGRLARFAGPPAVLYAAPEPDELLRRMTDALSSTFGLPPYGGIHADVVPHLAVAISDDPGRLAVIEAEVAAALPMSQAIDAVEVWRHDPGGWAQIHGVPLA